jgi:hypothetical protein
MSAELDGACWARKKAESPFYRLEYGLRASLLTGQLKVARQLPGSKNIVATAASFAGLLERFVLEHRSKKNGMSLFS